LRFILTFFIFIFFAFNGFAQVCTGSLGDPTVNINFGSGSSVGPALSSNNTTYPYNGNDCPGDGFYVINNKTQACFSNTWHTLAQDHTSDDNNGYMMIVNAGFTKQTFYTLNANNLCPNTTYEFAAFIVNLIKPNVCSPTQSKPKINFVIETEAGVKLGEYTTGSISESNSPQWNKYGFFFKTPINVTTVVLKLINDADGGCGNDLALDDITFRPCGPNITLTEPNISSVNNSYNVCESQSQNFNFSSALTSGFTNPSYQWQTSGNNGVDWIDVPNQNNSNFNLNITNANLSGYQYRLAVAEGTNIFSQSCRVYSNPIIIVVNPVPVVNAGVDFFLLEGSRSTINAVAPQNLNYKWEPIKYLDNPNSLNPLVTPLETTTYKLTATDPLTGCFSQDEVVVTVNNVLKIPDSFTPNDDGVNDFWNINGLAGNITADITVFNRNGEIIFKSLGYNQPWDGKSKGKNLPIGTYYYIINPKFQNLPIYKGSVFIFR
jgi:gliding motility-associated-like protein